MIIKYDRIEFMASGKNFDQFLEDKYGKGKGTIVSEDKNQNSLIIQYEQLVESQ